MALDASQPTNTVKIRDISADIRPNWVAIQNADSSFQPQAINFTDRTIASLPVNPTAISGAYITFCKTDTLGNSELFGINANSEVIQFTQGIPTFNTTQSSVFLPGGLMLKTGKSSFSALTLTAAITFTTAFPNECLGIIASLIDNPIGACIQSSYNVSGFSVARNSTGPINNGQFFWYAWGN